jgi:type I restriction enzyme, S subunit
MTLEYMKKLARVSHIPEAWDLTTVGEVCKVRNDLRKPISVEERSNIQGSYPYYGPTGVLDYIDEYLVDGEFALIGEDGDHFLKPQDKPQTMLVNGKLNANNHVHLIQSTKRCHAKWFYLYFHNRDITNFLSRQGANRYKLNKETLLRLPILVPPTEEQLAIYNANINWVEAIEKTEKLIQAKQTHLKQMSRKLVFGDVRLRKQKSTMVDGRFFRYPSDWSLLEIGDVSQEISLRGGDSAETVLSCSKYDGLVNSLDYFGKQVFSSDTSNYKVIKKGQFGYPSNHIEEGSIGLLEHCEVGIVSPIYVVFEVNGDRVHAPYLYKLLKTEVYRHIFQISTSSSVDRRGSLRWSEFSRLKIPLPSMAEQKKIAEALYVAEEEIKILKQLAEKYRVQKRGLMQKLLTGEWRVNTDEEVD